MVGTALLGAVQAIPIPRVAKAATRNETVDMDITEREVDMNVGIRNSATNCLPQGVGSNAPMRGMPQHAPLLHDQRLR